MAMTSAHGHLLVVDDKEKDGNHIAQSLWRISRHVLFVKYDERDLLKAKKHLGVRVVFMDINLSGDGHGGKKNFPAVEAALDALLHEKNGPYVLIVWSTWSTDAEGLFNYLREKLPKTKRPLDFKVLDKTDYMSHKQTKTKLKALDKQVTSMLDDFKTFAWITSWERAVQESAAGVVHSLCDGAGHEIETFDDGMTRVVCDLAEAQAGERFRTGEDISRPVAEVLGELLQDTLHATSIPLLPWPSSKPSIPVQAQEWKKTINHVLHAAPIISTADGSFPGNVFAYPSNRKLPRIAIDDQIAFIKQNYLRSGKEADRDAFCAVSSLLLLDITPPCDDANRKAVWRRFIVLVKVPQEAKKCFGKEDFLWRFPDMKDEESSFFLIANSRLIWSLPDNQAMIRKLGKPAMRLREPIIADMLGWVGRMVSRAGHISLR